MQLRMSCSRQISPKISSPTLCKSELGSYHGSCLVCSKEDILGLYTRQCSLWLCSAFRQEAVGLSTCAPFTLREEVSCFLLAIPLSLNLSPVFLAVRCRVTIYPVGLLHCPFIRKGNLILSPLHLTDLSNVQLGNLVLLYTAHITSTSFQLCHSIRFCCALSSTW